ncbi:WecB/TagA/CpsF family glycosyltransferase [Rhodococcus pyridinivorans]|uniref:WecB/TagA/CpsF family glycosyltransferase n=1 Tax=Rhodococcus pyridinivorans TaxID=103816 RepID=UPI00280AA023|nr:WecB/TagA/CpsF family glycosyltransferase [Rhodococcus pyridinivorans]WMM71985.1 WecB/TagA/CpsF family glycosyltransferase [Rhodococcus pyridinivorans]
MLDDSRAHLVVTPNIAHVFQSKSEPVLKRAYDRADFAPPDGWPVVSAIRFLLPEPVEVDRVAGSDLMIELCKYPVSVAIVGGAGTAAVDAARQLKAANDQLGVVCTEPVPRAEFDDDQARAQLIERIAESNPDITFIGLGVPRQEQLALELVERLDRGIVMCVGASIEFAAGSLRRAPEFLRRSRMEWAFRLAVEPRKLAQRYLLSAPFFIGTVAREKLRSMAKGSSEENEHTSMNQMQIDRLIVHQFDPARPSPGGIDTCIRGLLRYAPHGQRIAVVGVDTSSDKDATRCGQWETHVFEGNKFWFLPVAKLDPADQKRRIPHSVRLVAGLIRHRSRLPRAEVVQAHRMDTALSLLTLLRRPLAYFIHTQESGLTGETSDSIWRFAGKLHAKLEQYVVNQSRRIFVFNEDYAAVVRRWNRAAQFSPTWFDPALIERKELDRDQYRVLWVGRVEEPKDPLLAVRTFETLVAKRPDEPWTMDVVGSGTQLEEVREYIERAGLSARVIAHGRVEPKDVATLMSRTGVFLMTSHPGYEGYPRVLVEALASGAIAIVTTGADTGSLVKDGINGFTATDREPGSLAELVGRFGECNRSAARASVEHLEAPRVVEKIFAE